MKTLSQIHTPTHTHTCHSVSNIIWLKVAYVNKKREGLRGLAPTSNKALKTQICATHKICVESFVPKVHFADHLRNYTFTTNLFYGS